MGIQTHWHDDQQTIILTRCDNVWTWDDYHTATQEIRRLAQQITHPFVVIVDMSQSNILPKGGNISNVRVTHRKPLAHFRGVVIVGAPFLTSVLITTLRGFSPSIARKYFSAKTVADGLLLATTLRLRPPFEPSTP
ncbi:MAG: hypothetical protein ACOYL5_17265 [Phototrophicaceae bacterium]|jgi:hypothetical protein